MANTRKIRTRIYLAVEGEGERSFVRFLQALSDQKGLHVHLDCRVLGGGGYKMMLKRALQYQVHDSRRKSKPKESILVLDEDRDQRREDGWPLGKLRKEAKAKGFQVCAQQPNQEGLFFRMLQGNEKKQPNVKDVGKLLKVQWPAYRKPVDFYMLFQKFNLDDLLRVATVDQDLNELLSVIGLS